jgi:GNAT superfamily N-acetyltransferase
MIRYTFHTDFDPEPFFRTISHICSSEKYLSPRSCAELRERYMRHELLIAHDEHHVLVGWLMRIPYTPQVQEIASGYVLPEYRSRGVFRTLLHTLLPCTSRSIIATFHYPLAESLFRIGFTETTLRHITTITRCQFILHRLSIQRLFAIRNHYKTHPPRYCIYEQ